MIALGDVPASVQAEDPMCVAPLRSDVGQEPCGETREVMAQWRWFAAVRLAGGAP